MTLTDRLPQAVLSSVVATAALVLGALVAAPSASADPDDIAVCDPEVQDCSDDTDTCDPICFVPVDCEDFPDWPGCDEPPECDPEVEDCDEPPECDPEIEDCDDPPDENPPGENPPGAPGSGTGSVDPPVVANPTFTG